MKERPFTHRLFQFTVALALVLANILPASLAPVRAEEDYIFDAWLQAWDGDTGYVEINGVDTRQPGEPFTFEWGDGTITQSFFVGHHVYSDTSQNYTVKVTSALGGEVSVEVDFSQPPLYFPMFEAWTTLEPYRIHGFGWPFGKQVALTIDDPLTGEVFLTDTLTPGPAPWNPEAPFIDYEVAAGILLAGRRVRLDDGVFPRELIISDVAVTLVNVLTDRVDGTASPGTRIETWFCNDDGARCAFRWMVVGDDGKWFADFAHPMGTGVPEEDATVEITPYYYSTVVVRDEDNDKTVVHWVGIIPIVEANLTDNLIWSYDWSSGGEAYLEITRNGTMLYTDTRTLEHPEWNDDIFAARFELGDFRLEPGQVVTLRNADMEKTLEIVDLRVTKVDADADTIEGYAPPGSVVDTSYLCDDQDCAWRLTTADENGYWKADYGQPSGLNNGNPAFENTFDIQPGFCNDARVFEEDRDNTRVMWCASIHYDIYAFDPLTGAITLLTKNLKDTDEYNPSWSPNGKKIAHDVVDPGVSHGIYITDVKTGVSTPLVGAQDGGNDAVWSQNGKWIVFDQLGIGDASLYLVPATGGAPKLVRHDAVSADWAPNGKRLVFQQPSDGSLRTVAVDGGKGGETVIAASGANPAWSPDGNWIAYEYEGDIWKQRVNVQGTVFGNPVRVTSGPFEDGQPTWSADSQTIVYHSGLGGDYDLWSIPAAGGEPVWLNGAPEFGDYDPAYARNSAMIAYASPSPDGQAPRDWVAAFTYDLPAGYWSPGVHTYQFLAPDENYSEEYTFTVSTDSPTYEGAVLIRMEDTLRAWNGASCSDVDAIHPNQRTQFHVGWTFTGSYAGALAFYDNDFHVVWDGSASVVMTGHMAFPRSSGLDWFGYTCTFTLP